MNILFTCAGRRNYLIKYFKELIGESGKVIAVDMQSFAPALAIADQAFKVPDIFAENYIEAIFTICKTQNIDVIFSLNDLELPLLSANKDIFENIGVQLIVSSQDVVNICFDKWRSVQFANEIGVPTPRTYIDYSNAVEAIKNELLKFPIVLKPRWGSASIGLVFPENFEEFELTYKLLSRKLFRTSLASASKSDPNHAILIQEKIIGIEYGMDVLNDLSGRPHQVYVKEKLAMRAGETDKAVLRHKPELENIGFKIGKALKHIGNLDCDIFESDGKYYLLEMNPRFGGGYPFTHMAGANYPAALMSWIAKKEFDFSCFKRNYDQIFSKFDDLIPVKDDSQITFIGI